MQEKMDTNLVLYSHLDQIGESLVEGRWEKEKRGGALLELHIGPVVAELVVRLVNCNESKSLQKK